MYKRSGRSLVEAIFLFRRFSAFSYPHPHRSVRRAMDRTRCRGDHRRQVRSRVRALDEEPRAPRSSVENKRSNRQERESGPRRDTEMGGGMRRACSKKEPVRRRREDGTVGQRGGSRGGLIEGGWKRIESRTSIGSRRFAESPRNERHPVGRIGESRRDREFRAARALDSSTSDGSGTYRGIARREKPDRELCKVVYDRSPSLWYSVFDANADPRQRLDHLLHRRLVREREQDRGCEQKRVKMPH